jgi:uncharacterized protein (DUF2147 family)
MKALVFGAAALLVSALAAQADPVEGVWQTARDDNGNFGHIQIAPCGDRLCGVLIRAYNGAGQQIDSDNVGRRIVWDMVARGDGAYGKGKIWSPDRDKTYNSKMELAGDRLTVSGCVLVICRDGGTWARVK